MTETAKKRLIKSSLAAFLLMMVIFPLAARAEGSSLGDGNIGAIGTTPSSVMAIAAADYTFKARVLKVLEERKVTREDGSIDMQQNLLLLDLSSKNKGRQVSSIGIGDFDVVTIGDYREGDSVYVDVITNENGEQVFFVTDYDRTGWLYVLAAIFIAVTLLVGGRKGFKSLLSLLLSFAVIVFLVVPQLLSGANPLPVAVLGSLLIMVLIIYLTDGFNKKSHLGVLSVFISLLLTFALAYLFTWLTRLSGFSSEEATLLIGTSAGTINFQGLLLAGILIGAVGVLDDIILGQIEAVAQIKKANSDLATGEVFKMAIEIGRTHLGAIINTLFLTYTGASLALLMLFYIRPSGSADFFQVINNDVIATEIVRTLVGSIGLMLAMPISTYLAARLLKGK